MVDTSNYGVGDIAAKKQAFADSLVGDEERAKRYVQYGLAGTPLAQSSAMNYGLAEALNPFSKAKAEYGMNLQNTADQNAYQEKFKLADLLGTYEGQDTMAAKAQKQSQGLANAQFSSSQTGQQYKYDAATGSYVPVTDGTGKPLLTGGAQLTNQQISSGAATEETARTDKQLAIDLGYDSINKMKLADPAEVTERLKYKDAKPGAIINTDVLGFTPDSSWAPTGRSNIFTKRSGGYVDSTGKYIA